MTIIHAGGNIGVISSLRMKNRESISSAVLVKFLQILETTSELGQKHSALGLAPQPTSSHLSLQTQEPFFLLD